MRVINKLAFRSFNFSTSAKLASKERAGDVYIWSKRNQTKLDLPEKAKRVCLGQRHNAIIGESGYLYPLI